MSVSSAQTMMRRLAAEASTLVNDPSKTTAQKRVELDKIEVDLKAAQGEIELHRKAALYASGGSSVFGDDGLGGAFAGSYASTLSNGRASRLNLDEPTLRALHQAAVTKQPIRLGLGGPTVVTKDVSGVSTKALPMTPEGNLPAQYIGLVPRLHEPTRVLDLIPASPMNAPSVEFITHSSTVGAATVVAEGATKPSVEFVTAATTLVARKIAAYTSVTDEVLADFREFAQYLTMELTKAIIDAENLQVLSGTGVAPQLTGLLNVSGILTQAVAVAPDTNIDAIERAIMALRTGSSFTSPSALVINPADWSAIRRLKNTQGAYLLNADPTSDEANTLWGIPVVATTTCPANTALLGNFEIAAQAFIKQGMVIDTTNSDGTDFQTNTTKYRAEERLTVGVARPSALVKITLL